MIIIPLYTNLTPSGSDNIFTYLILSITLSFAFLSITVLSFEEEAGTKKNLSGFSRSIYKEDIEILNMYASNIRALKYVKKHR